MTDKGNIGGGADCSGQTRQPMVGGYFSEQQIAPLPSPLLVLVNCEAFVTCCIGLHSCMNAQAEGVGDCTLSYQHLLC